MKKTQPQLTALELQTAADQLAELDRGREVLKAIQVLSKSGFRGLDLCYQPLAMKLIQGMSNEGGYAGSVPTFIQHALSTHGPEHTD